VTITQRDRRALILFGMAVLVIIIYLSTTSGNGAKVIAPVASKESIPMAEQRLTRMRQSVARVPAREVLFQQVSAELAEREKNLIEAETGAQATEKLLEIVRGIARAQTPPVEVRSVELGPPRPYGDAYGEVTVSINTECTMDQLVNLMADISARKELISTKDLRVAPANPKQKTVNVRLTAAGLVPPRLVPKGRESF